MKRKAISVVLLLVLCFGISGLSSHAGTQHNHDTYIYNNHHVNSHPGPCWVSGCTITYDDYYAELRCRTCDWAQGVATTEIRSHSKSHH